MPGVNRLLDELSAAEIPFAVATSATREYADNVLTRLKLKHRFRFVLTAEDIRFGKPAPDIYLLAAARLQLAFYATTRTYLPILELHGRASIQGELRRAFVRRDHDRMAALVDDEFLDAVAIAGRPDEVRDRLAGWAAVPGLDRVILAAPWYATAPGWDRRATESILAVFPAR